MTVLSRPCHGATRTPRLPADVVVTPQAGGGRHRADPTPRNGVERLARRGDDRYSR